MLLFDIIRDWFVMYIWGGSCSQGFFSCPIGYLGFIDVGDTSMSEGLSGDTAYTGFLVNLYNFDHDNVGQAFISMGDWLSTTSTIIVMILLCIVFGLMVRWLFRLTAGLLRGN